jgi:thymidylate kinase
MLKIDSTDLEEILFAIETVANEESCTEKKFQEFEEHLLEKSRTIPKTLLQEFIEITKLLLKPSSQKKLGSFLVITGMDKSGKETQAFNYEHKAEICSVSEYLENNSFEVFRLALPSYNTTFGSLIASYLGKENSTLKIEGGNLSKDIAWVLWSLDRAQHNAEIQRWLTGNARRAVVSKRWTETNIAYQKPQGIDERRILDLERNLARVDYTIVLDVSLGTVFARMTASGEVPDRYETPELLAKVSDVYKNLERVYPIGKIIHLDGSGSYSEVNKALLRTIAKIGLGQNLQTISERFC